MPGLSYFCLAATRTRSAARRDTDQRAAGVNAGAVGVDDHVEAAAMPRTHLTRLTMARCWIACQPYADAASI